MVCFGEKGLIKNSEWVNADYNKLALSIKECEPSDSHPCEERQDITSKFINSLRVNVFAKTPYINYEKEESNYKYIRVGGYHLEY